MRRFSQNERLNGAVAGVVSAFSLLADAKDRRIFLALMFFSRAMDILLNVLKKRGIDLRFKYGEVVIWSIMGCFNTYLNSYEPECLNPSFRAFYWKYTQQTRADFELCGLWIQ